MNLQTKQTMSYVPINTSTQLRKNQIEFKIVTMEFCTRLAIELMLKKVEKNMVVSPISLNVVLNMLAAGSKGTTLDQFLYFLGPNTVEEINSESSKMMAVAADVGLHSENNNDIGPTLAMVNGAWFDRKTPMKPSYDEKILKGIFNCKAKTVDFANESEQLREEINAWAEAASRGLIKDFLKPGSPNPASALVLTNGLYFKGKWETEYRFDPVCTKDRDFYLRNGAKVSVPFMSSAASSHYCNVFDGFKVLRIPYEMGNSSREFSMYFLLPDERDGLTDLLKKLTTSPGRYLIIVSQINLAKCWIPKFKFRYGFEALSVMHDLGAPESFLKNPQDYSEMMHVPKEVPYFVPEMIQKAFIEIDEEGTEAAAVTQYGMSLGSSMHYKPPKLISFVADHPFLFVIKEANSGLVFFTGAMLDPSKSD